MGRSTTNRLPTRTRCGAAGRLVVAGTVVMVLGLGAVMASPVSFPRDRGDVARLRPQMVIDGDNASSPDLSPKGPARPPALLSHLAGESQGRRDFLRGTAIQIYAPELIPSPGARPDPPRGLLRGKAGRCRGAASVSVVPLPCAHCDAASPVWEPVQDGLPQDRRAFLLDTAIQVHAPASAPVPRRSAPPHPHGVD